MWIFSSEFWETPFSPEVGQRNKGKRQNLRKISEKRNFHISKPRCVTKWSTDAGEEKNTGEKSKSRRNFYKPNSKNVETNKSRIILKFLSTINISDTNTEMRAFELCCSNNLGGHLLFFFFCLKYMFIIRFSKHNLQCDHVRPHCSYHQISFECTALFSGFARYTHMVSLLYAIMYNVIYRLCWRYHNFSSILLPISQFIWHVSSEIHLTGHFTKISEAEKTLANHLCDDLKIIHFFLFIYLFSSLVWPSLVSKKRLWRESASPVWKLLFLSQSNSKRSDDKRNLIQKWAEFKDQNRYYHWLWLHVLVSFGILS